MTRLSKLITRLKNAISKNELYIQTIKHPNVLITSLQELNDLIGNDKVKDSVAKQITHLIMVKMRSLENSSVKEDDVMLNTILYGPPGVGKTLVGNKIAKIWYALGYLDGTNNRREKKQELGDVLKDLFGENAGTNTSSSGDSSLVIYALFVFSIIFITLLSLAWSFYSKFGGIWTLVVVGLILLIIICVGLYISSIVNASSKNNNKNNKNKNSGINNINTKNEFGNSPVIDGMVTDDQIIKVVTRTDFIHQYVGWSAKKTLELLQNNLGKVVFIDEAYSLVTDMHDTFGMEALNTINLFMSQHPREIILIFAGYKDKMQAGIFSFQPGLCSRFMWHFDCNGYNEEQLFDIFKLKLRKKGWSLTNEEETKQLFLNNGDSFPAFGRSVERLAFYAEAEHSDEYIYNSSNMQTNKLSPIHIQKGLAILDDNNIEGEEIESNDPTVNIMKMFGSKTNTKKKKVPKKPKADMFTDVSGDTFYSEDIKPMYSDKSELLEDNIMSIIKNNMAERVYM